VEWKGENAVVVNVWTELWTETAQIVEVLETTVEWIEPMLDLSGMGSVTEEAAVAWEDLDVTTVAMTAVVMTVVAMIVEVMIVVEIEVETETGSVVLTKIGGVL